MYERKKLCLLWKKLTVVEFAQYTFGVDSMMRSTELNRVCSCFLHHILSIFLPCPYRNDFHTNEVFSSLNQQTPRCTEWLRDKRHSISSWSFKSFLFLHSEIMKIVCRKQQNRRSVEEKRTDVKLHSLNQLPAMWLMRVVAEKIKVDWGERRYRI